MSVTGQFSDRFAGTFGGFHAVIDCLYVNGNEAWVSGTITQSSTPGVNVGDPVGARVRDNGKSRNDPPDETSFSNIGDPTRCDEMPDYDLFSYEKGQVTVR